MGKQYTCSKKEVEQKRIGMLIGDWDLFELNEKVVYQGPVDPHYQFRDFQVGRAYTVSNILILGHSEYIQFKSRPEFYDVRMFCSKRESAKINELISKLLN